MRAVSLGSRSPLRKISDKKLKSLGGKTPFSSITSKRKRVKAWKRKPSEFKRIYGSKQRVLFVKTLPCAACGVVGYSENAHVLGTGGLSRKAAYETIAPLCGPYLSSSPILGIIEGCHQYYDEDRGGFDELFITFDPAKAAADCEARWQQHLKEQNAE